MKRIKKIFRIHSIQTSIILSFMLLISIIVLFLSMISYYFTIQDIESMSISYTHRLLQEINFSIDSYISNMKNMGKVIVENRDVENLMVFYNKYNGKTLTKTQREQRDELLARAVNHMNTVANTRNDITNIAVISKKGNIVLSNPQKRPNPYSEYNITDWYLKPLSYTKDIIVSPSHVQNLVEDEYKWVISISKAIIDPQSGEVVGVMVIDLNYKYIESICENAQLGKNGYIYLLDNGKNIIYHPQQQLIYTGVKDELVDEILKMKNVQAYVNDHGINKIYLKNVSSLTGWNAVGVVNASELIRDKQNIINFYVFLAGIAIIFASIIALILSKAITRPVKMLETTMHKVEEGNFDVKSEIRTENEIGHLSKTFNVMISKIKLLMEAAVKNEEEKRKNEIKALQAQINPHFLYNTLDTIIWMSAGGKNEEVVEVTSALARLFRTSIDEGGSLVPLAIEIENIKSYLTIQKMRYKDKLTYRVEVPEELSFLKTPKLILQPIVENAVYHGIKMSETGGEIFISASTTARDLIITVQDSGVGMSAEQIENLFIKDKQDHSGMGIGVINVNNRIKLCFGERYGLFYSSVQGRGTKVDILLPRLEDGESEDG
ncbi:MAG TPA: sensor histidine kinase [Caproiciproducens sp.]|nr:sensor histidine kinase [Caproiciproducens sp.]